VEVADEDVDTALKDLQEQYAERVSVDRSAQLSDLAVLDVEGTVGDRVVLKLEEQEYELQEGSDAPVPDLADKLVGMSPGEEKSFNLTFPDDYEDEDLAGLDVSFLVHLHSLQEKHLPEVDDELAKMVGGFENIEKLRQEIAQDLHTRRWARQQDESAERLLDALLEQAEIDSPPAFVNRELESMVGGLAYDLQRQGFTLESYLKTTDRSVEDLVEEFRPTAEKRVSKSLILAQLVKEEGVEVEDEEIEQEVASMTRVYGQEKDVLRDALLRNEQIKEEIRNKLYGRKVVQRLAGLSQETEGQETEAGDAGTDREEKPRGQDAPAEPAQTS
jgi:trigger factor